MLKKDLAICIRTIDYSDTSQILTFFSRDHGKFDAIAKGSKRAKSPFGGPIEIFSFGDVVFAEAGHGKLSSISEFTNQPRFFGLRRNLDSLNAALFGAELLELLTQDFDAHPPLFDIFTDFCDRLQVTPSRQHSIASLIAFQLELLREIGQGLVLDSCSNCRTAFNPRWPVVFFSSSAHGLICRDCEGAFADKLTITLQAAAALAAPEKLDQLPAPALESIEKTLISYFTDLLHKPPRLARTIIST